MGLARWLSMMGPLKRVNLYMAILETGKEMPLTQMYVGED